MNELQRVPAVQHREFRTDDLEVDLVVAGGGMAGMCCAITAARAGARVVLVQDRPVLGGNASSEVRVPIAGAAGYGIRWAREGGVIDEILVENSHKNPEGNPVLFDHILLEKVHQERGITLLLNTHVFEVVKDGPRIGSVRAFCSQNSTMYRISGRVFCDASGDGVLGYLSGAAFRIGAESKDEFDESFAPEKEYGALLGDSILLQTRDVGRPVRFEPPAYALDDVTRIPKHRAIDFNADAAEDYLWWAEYGGRLDTVHDTEQIKWELWSVVYGIWDYLKNSGKFPDAEDRTLDWVGLVPGKRESRRFEGLYMLRQQDIVEQVEHYDGVAFGGFPIDLHPADGVFSEFDGDHRGARLLAVRGMYQVPLRCMMSRDVPNLFLAGRLISVTHVALGSTRQMGTCAHMGQAVGMAAAACVRDDIEPHELLEPDRMRTLRMELLRTGQHIPGTRLEDPRDIAQEAEVSASSEFVLDAFPADGPAVPLDRSRAQLLPVQPGRLPAVTFTVDVRAPTTLRVEARVGNRPDDFTPDVVLGTQEIELGPGVRQHVCAEILADVDQPRYVFFCLMENEMVSVHTSTRVVTGVTSVTHRRTQTADETIGRPRVEFWSPVGASGQNLACIVDPPLRPFGAANVANRLARPTSHPNAWVAEPTDRRPAVTLRWPVTRQVSEVVLSFDTNSDRHLPSVRKAQAETPIIRCVRHYRLTAGDDLVAERTDNYQTRNRHVFDPPVITDQLVLEIVDSTDVTASVFEVRCYEDDRQP